MADFDEHNKKALQLRVDDIKIKYRDMARYETEICEAEDLIKGSCITCETLASAMREQDGELQNLMRLIQRVCGHYMSLMDPRQ